MTADIKKLIENVKLKREILANDVKRIENRYSNMDQYVVIKNKKVNQKKEFWLETLRPALLKYWCFNRSLFPLIHYSKQHLKSLNEAKESSKEKTVLGPFPIEIWEIIMQKGGIRMEVLSINRAIFNGLAPYVYGGSGIEKLQLLLVVSSTKKMRQNDACFLREGPDFPDKPCDSYSIYERNLESSKYEYEFLDVSYDVARAFPDEKTLVITDYDEIKMLFYHVMNNPDSILRRTIKSINVDISILHGYQELVYDSQVYRVLEHFGRSLGIERVSSRTQVKADGFFYGPDSHQLFNEEESRWDDPRLGISKTFDPHSFSKVPYNTANEVFPNKVYFNELVHLSELFKSYDSGGRSELCKITTKDKLRKNHPYKKYVLSPEQITQDPEFDVEQLKVEGEIASHNIKIIKRRFASDKKVQSLIKLMVETLSSDKIFNDTDTSLFISGMPDFQETRDFLKKTHGGLNISKICTSTNHILLY
ncbi:hypothetical protein BN7_5813 [Wickerhamomyces ciferrii]|uniref:Uncharacterized protein n=1 Tax=Wickerhamomyces ciferrii (strain ATCC 14091 / BCRC 22168 / CBS 111 / JCM 3599 / NBRC 0793 / NRRL Y-1031 F-60-10) TaxID=1206466 RepID=K0KW72_WICCF|nr:uncharacterized protein BN7_5813 [Wickerhamomyces ciferrii]CCH46222.1 hypothetical protein BN7_5813 [Wickerhamomyces ciferrii]